MKFIDTNIKYPSFILETRAILDTNKIQRLTERVADVVRNMKDMGKISEFKCSASLAHHGILRSLDLIDLYDVDLSTVPAQPPWPL